MAAVMRCGKEDTWQHMAPHGSRNEVWIIYNGWEEDTSDTVASEKRGQGDRTLSYYAGKLY